MRAETERLGDKAPQTAGYIAQDIITAFDSVGLDAIALGVVHADADADGNVTYGINYTVANILASCCNTARIASLNERISQLEESLSRISLM